MVKRSPTVVGGFSKQAGEMWHVTCRNPRVTRSGGLLGTSWGMTGVEMDMFDLMFRTLLGFALFVLATAFAIVAAPILLPTLAILAALREKPEGRERRHRPFLRKAQRITVSAQQQHAVLGRSEEHTSELQSPCNFVCRL